MTDDFRRQNLIVNERVEQYDGTTAVVRTQELGADEIEFLRWRKERWIKTAHFPKATLQNPKFVFRNGIKMLKHTFRGCTWRTLLGLEDEREAFRRYCAIRAQEREYM